MKKMRQRSRSLALKKVQADLYILSTEYVIIQSSTITSSAIAVPVAAIAFSGTPNTHFTMLLKLLILMLRHPN